MKLSLVESSWRRRVSVALLLAPLLSCAPSANPAPDLILFNGRILTVDETFSIAEAVAIKDIRAVVTVVGGEPVHGSFEILSEGK